MATISSFNYSHLEKKILEKGLCSGCGTCEATCPTGALRLKESKPHLQYDCTQFRDSCTICHEVCPHSEMLLLDCIEAVSQAPECNEAIGYFRKILLAQSADTKMRQQTAGGAVVTSLLSYGIDNKIFDSAIVSQSEQKDPARPQPSVALTSEEVVSAIGSKFFPSATVSAYSDAVLRYGKTKVAVVGVPCHVLGLRKIEAWHHKISGRQAMLIGLFCSGTFTQEPMMEFLKETYNVEPSEIKQMYFAGQFIVETEKERIEVPVKEIKAFSRTSCKYCVDFTSEAADISIGSGHPLPNTSIVILRTKRGEDFFYEAMEKGIINARGIKQEAKLFEHMIMAALRKRAKGATETIKQGGTVRFSLASMLMETHPLASIKVEDIMTPNITVISSEATVSQLLELMATENRIAYPVEEKGKGFLGIVTMEQASKVDKDKRNETLVGTIANRALKVVFPGKRIVEIFNEISQQDLPQVIVQNPQNPKGTLGIITQKDLMQLFVNGTNKKSNR